MRYARLLIPAMIFSALVVLVAFTASPGLLFTGPGQDGCPNAKALDVRNVTDTSATVSWRLSDSTTSVNLRWRYAGDTVWTELQEVTSPVELTLEGRCEIVTVQLQPRCADETGDFDAEITFQSDGCCRLPSAFRVASATDSSATLKWDAVRRAEFYALRYRAVDDTLWLETESGVDSIVLEDLLPCTQYDVQLMTFCDGETALFGEPLILETPGCGVCTEGSYCPAEAFDARRVWVDSVGLGNLTAGTGFSDGYLERASVQTNLERGRTYTISVAPGFSTDPCPHFMRVWLDLDQDAVFDDSTELLIDTFQTGGQVISASLSIADSLQRGVTRLRVMVKAALETDTIPPDPCETFNFGEVEDYCIRIDDVCPFSELLGAAAVSETEAFITWEPNDKAFGYVYSFGEADGEQGENTVTGDTMASLQDLRKCTEYEFRLLHVCLQDTTVQSIIFKTECETAVEIVPEQLAQMTVFPNPFAEVFTVEIATDKDYEAVLQVYSINGQLLHSEKLTLLRGETQRRQIRSSSSWVSGVYLTHLRTADGVITKKVVRTGY